MSFLGIGNSSVNAEKQKMTITRALVELKTLDKRIQKSIDESLFVSIEGELRKPDVRAEKAQANYDRVRDLLERRVRIKSSIVISNATTTVRICGRDMTVAEAIELKTSIKNYKNLLSQMKRQYGNSVQSMELENDRARRTLESSLVRNDSDKEKDRQSVEDYSRQYMKVNGVKLYDPLDITNKITEVDKFVVDFESEVDFILSERNATTFIEV